MHNRRKDILWVEHSTLPSNHISREGANLLIDICHYRLYVGTQTIEEQTPTLLYI